MYQLEYEKKDIVLRFNKDSIDKPSLVKVLEYLEVEQLRMKSKLSENDVKRLATEINKRAWEKLKYRYIEE